MGGSLGESVGRGWTVERHRRQTASTAVDSKQRDGRLPVAVASGQHGTSQTADDP